MDAHESASARLFVLRQATTTIQEYAVPWDGAEDILMARSGRVVGLGCREYGRAVIWVAENGADVKALRRFTTVGNGQTVPCNSLYYGTATFGTNVRHVLEVEREGEIEKTVGSGEVSDLQR